MAKTSTVKTPRAKPLAAKKPALKETASGTSVLAKVISVKTPKVTTAAKSPLVKTPTPKSPTLNAQATTKLSKANIAAKTEKSKKPKLMRDSFTIPKAEYVVLDELKLRAAKLTRPAKKSELLRAGIKALAAMSNAAFLTALEQVPAIKTGRPAAGK